MSPQLVFKWRVVLSTALLGILFAIAYVFFHGSYERDGIIEALCHGILKGFWLGASIGITEQFVLPDQFKKKTFLTLLLIRTVIYSAFIFLWVSLGGALLKSFFNPITVTAALKEDLVSGGLFIDFIFSIMATFVVVAVLQIQSLHGKGEIRDYVLGRYNQPREEDRIFMFVDLKSSTTIAEALGNLTYSRFIRDFFFDMTETILITHADVYQYVGDEIILSWPTAKGIRKERCIECFYLMKEKIEAKKEAYLQEYGYFPRFKAGMHCGKVVITWVGEVKKAIVYHGDVLNTTARIQALCNEVGQEFLISKDLLNKFEGLNSVEATYVNTLLLRGKLQEVSLYGLRTKEKEVTMWEVLLR